MLRILILLISIASGSGAAWLTLQMQPQEGSGAVVAAALAATVAPPAIQYEDVLVAAVDLAARRRLVKDDLNWQPWPEEAIGPGFVTRSAHPDLPDELVGSMVRNAMFVGEPINQAKLSSTGRGFLSASLPSGMRAVAVRVSAETMAGGFVLPDDRVDVLHTTATADDSGNPRGVGRTILTNIRVLAVDQLSEAAETDSVVPGRTATLQLTPLQAEVVAGAEAVGTLSLALRSTDDDAEPTLYLEPTVEVEPTVIAEWPMDEFDQIKDPDQGKTVTIITPGWMNIVEVN